MNGSGAPRLAVVAAALVASLAPLVVYLPTPGDYWIRYDNEVLIRQEPMVRILAADRVGKPEALVRIFRSVHGDLYQPLLTLSLAVDYALFGWDRSGFHAHSLLLHCVLMGALFLLALRLAREPWAALAATLLAGLHPAAVEPVSWIIHRTLLETAFWLLLGTHAYLSYARDPRRWPWLVAATLALGTSFMGKAIPSVVVVPFLIDAWVHRRPSIRLFLEKTPLLVLAGFFTWLNFAVSRQKAAGIALEGIGLDAITKAPSGLLLSIANTVAPRDLAIFYPASQIQALLGLRLVVAVGVVFLVTALAVFLWRRGSRGLLLGLVGWVALLSPFLFASAFRDVVTADRYTYVASLLLGPGLAEALAALRPRAPRWRAVAAAGVGLVVAVFALQARGQAREWADEVVLWRSVLEKGDHPLPYGAMGNVWAQRRRWDEAVASYERAVALAEGEFASEAAPIFHQNLSNFSFEAYRHVRSQDPGADAQRRRYVALSLDAARRGLERWPRFAVLHYNEGRALLAAEQPDEALAAFERALELDPTLPAALAGAGDLRRARGEFGPAMQLYLRWAVVDPRDADPHRRVLETAEAALAAEQAESVLVLLEYYLERFPESGAARALLQRVSGSGSASG